MALYRRGRSAKSCDAGGGGGGGGASLQMRARRLQRGQQRDLGAGAIAAGAGAGLVGWRGAVSRDCGDPHARHEVRSSAFC
jgi:hypothetical protein